MDGSWAVPGYRQIRTLGEGASGRVELAVHEADGAPVAIKYLSPQLSTDPVFLDRFRAEAQLMADLNDPDLVRFYEYVEGPGTAALVMELVDGVTLKEIITSEGPTGPEAALVVLKGSLRGLAVAHAVGVVHRDYKPGNVLVREDGRSKLADFGIAVKVDEEVTASGTPAYMAPEQWHAGVVGPATDVYAATAVFYECLTGERPYPVKGLWALAAAHRFDPIPYERVPTPLQGLVAHGLAKAVADRPPSAAAFLAELELVAVENYGPNWEDRGRVRLAALAAILAALFPLADPLPTASTALALTRLGRRRIALAAGVAVGALLAGGGGAIALAAVQHHVTPLPGVTSTPSAALGPTTSPAPVDSPAPSDSPAPTPDPEATPPDTTPVTGPPTDQPTIAPVAKPTPVVTKKPVKTTVSGMMVSAVTSDSTTTATVTFTVKGPGSVTVTATFTPENGATARAVRAASAQNPQTVSGSGPHTLTFDFDNGGACPGPVDVSVTTSRGGSASTVASDPCVLE